MNKWSRVHRITVFTLWYIFLSFTVGTIISVAIPPSGILDIGGILVGGLSAFATVYLMKRKTVIDGKSKRPVALEFAATTLVLPTAFFALLVLFGFLIGEDVFARVFLAWQQAGFFSFIMRVVGQLINAGVVFFVTQAYL